MSEPAESTGGLLALKLARRGDGRTGIVERRQRFPLRMTVPLYLDAAAPDLPFIYVQNPTGGLFPDDDLLISLELAPEARVHVTTQAATKAYAGDGPGARQRTRLRLEPGAYAEVIPDTLIPHAGANVDQQLDVELGEGAAVVSTELLGPGRIAVDERFAYERVRLTTAVRELGSAAASGDAPASSELCVDTLELEPARRSPAARGVLGGRSYLGTFVAVAPHVDAERLAGLIDTELAVDARVSAAAGTLPNGAGVGARVLASKAADARTALDAAWAVARQELLGAPLPVRRK